MSRDLNGARDKGIRQDVAIGLRSLLIEVRGQVTPGFSGLGLLVSDEPDALPIVPLRRTTFAQGDTPLAHSLAAISRSSSEFHDGFHVVNSRWELTHVAQYFSPPIVDRLVGQWPRPAGGRYLAAMFGSVIPQVLASGVLSTHYGIVVLQQGEEVFSEAYE